MGRVRLGNGMFLCFLPPPIALDKIQVFAQLAYHKIHAMNHSYSADDTKVVVLVGACNELNRQTTLHYIRRLYTPP